MSAAVYLVRHGAAEPPSAGIADEARNLTAAGTRILAAAAAGLRRLHVVPDVILVSPLARALETAQILAHPLAPGVAVQATPALAPGNPVRAIVALLGEHLYAEQIVLVGHEPTMGELTSCLLTGSPGVARLRFKPGAVAAVDLTSLTREGPATLRWFIRAEELADIGKAES